MEALQRPHAMLRDALRTLLLRLEQMRLHREIELVRVHHDFRPARVTDGVWRVGSERKRNQGFMFPRVARGKSGLEISVDIGGVRRRKIKYRQADHRSH